MATTAEQATKRYLDAAGSGASRQKYIDGINSTTVNPMAEAAKNEELYLRNVTESVRSGRRAAKLNSVPVERWKKGAVTKGADRLASGAAAAADKVRAHFQTWMPIYQNVSQVVNAMPKGSTEDSIARAAAAIRMLKQAAGKS